MRLWSSRLLERELAEGCLSEREKVKYLLLPLIAGSLLSAPIYLITPNYGVIPPLAEKAYIFLGNIALSIVTFYGIRMGYRTNKNIDGKNFIERYIILSLPIFVKFTVFCLPGLFCFMILFGVLQKQLPWMKDNFSLVLRMLFPFILLWFYYLISESINRFGKFMCSDDSHGGRKSS